MTSVLSPSPAMIPSITLLDVDGNGRAHTPEYSNLPRPSSAPGHKAPTTEPNPSRRFSSCSARRASCEIVSRLSDSFITVDTFAIPQSKSSISDTHHKSCRGSQRIHHTPRRCSWSGQRPNSNPVDTQQPNFPTSRHHRSQSTDSPSNHHSLHKSSSTIMGNSLSASISSAAKKVGNHLPSMSKKAAPAPPAVEAPRYTRRIPIDLDGNTDIEYLQYEYQEAVDALLELSPGWQLAVNHVPVEDVEVAPTAAVLPSSSREPSGPNTLTASRTSPLPASVTHRRPRKSLKLSVPVLRDSGCDVFAAAEDSVDDDALVQPAQWVSLDYSQQAIGGLVRVPVKVVNVAEDSPVAAPSPANSEDASIMTMPIPTATTKWPDQPPPRPPRIDSRPPGLDSVTNAVRSMLPSPPPSLERPVRFDSLACNDPDPLAEYVRWQRAAQVEKERIRAQRRALVLGRAVGPPLSASSPSASPTSPSSAPAAGRSMFSSLRGAIRAARRRSSSSHYAATASGSPPRHSTVTRNLRLPLSAAAPANKKGHEDFLSLLLYHAENGSPVAYPTYDPIANAAACRTDPERAVNEALFIERVACVE
ncbi:uncharacterized protein EV422DRAFT_508807 [Fimicolochytrium jonesii]|uniref:uncharacterized protein n=1 Tax=Fimicolochytrium jonesii TaxID=1396493 RepID=UPI0022FE09A6|nr:uncharacterized protein EV422DRAFT_508807 [Fimicolochytrium jonesii]KAI8817739.1 hypothetical protein EV422DRAFT_508807 [Fimicolochytrium jonesii]